VSSACGLDANYIITEDGKAYLARIQLDDTDRYQFFEPGSLGERTKMDVSDVLIDGRNTTFEWASDVEVSFEKGDHTISYNGTIINNQFRAMFMTPMNVTILLPNTVGVTNPLLAMISGNAEIITEDDGSAKVVWNDTRAFTLQYYDPMQEFMLTTFGTIWVVLVIVFMVPYLGQRMRKKE